MYDMQMRNEKWKSVIACFNFIEIINDGRLVISLVDIPAKNENSNWKVVRRRVGGGMYDRKRCSEMFESLIPLQLYIFIHVPAKLLKLFLERGREKGRGTQV